MQISTLNKIINLYFVGTLIVAVAIGTWISLYSVPPALVPDKDWASPFLVFSATVASLPLLVILGLFADSAASLLVRRFIDLSVRSRRAMKWLGVARNVEHIETYQKAVECLLKKAPSYRWIIRDNVEGISRSLAVAILLRSGPKENLEYAMQRYALYGLAASSLLVLSIGFLSFVFLSLRQGRMIHSF